MPLYELDSDIQTGFNKAVQNGQTRLALEYAIGIINDLYTSIDSLQEQIDSLKPATKSPMKKDVKTESTADNE